MLIQNIQKLDEIPDDLAGRDVRICSDPAVLHLNKLHPLLLPDAASIPVKPRMHIRQLFRQDKHFLRGKRLQTDDRRHHIPGALHRKPALLQTRAECLIAVDTAARILDALRRTGHQHPDIVRFSLERVIVHRQNLLVVVVARDRIRDLVDVHKFIDKDHQSLVTGLPEEKREQLQVIVPVLVCDDDIHPQILPGLRPCRVLPSEPLENLRLLCVVSVLLCLEVQRQQPCKIKPVNHPADRIHHQTDLLRHAPAECR